METPTTGRLLAVDWGAKRTGLAVTDPQQLIASALTTVRTHELIDFLKQYDTTEGIAAFVVGEPRRLDNTPTHATAPTEAFVRRLRKQFPDKAVHRVDERFTSRMALRAMIDAGSKRKDRRRKENIDKVSAAIILQSFLEQRR
ncbi:MAG: Holliday junction resolvase RuvX [Catalinimonas sp.]